MISFLVAFALLTGARAMSHMAMSTGDCSCQFQGHTLPSAVYTNYPSSDPGKYSNMTMYPAITLYGTMCAPWDQMPGTPWHQYCGPAGGDFSKMGNNWCQQPWCYVGSDCSHGVASSVFAGADSTAAYYSYLSCGHTADCYTGVTKETGWPKGCPYDPTHQKTYRVHKGGDCECMFQGMSLSMDIYTNYPLSDVGKYANYGSIKYYGTTCAAWDQLPGTPWFSLCPVLTNGMPTDWCIKGNNWCQAPWCYVSKRCQSGSASSVFDGSPAAFYSYDTCLSTPDCYTGKSKYNWMRIMPKQCPFDASVNMWYTPKMCDNRWWVEQMADNETNETEILVVTPMVKTPPPTNPVVEFSMVAEVTSAAAAVVSKSALLATVKATLGSDKVDDSDIIVEQEFQVVQELTIPGADAGNMKEDVLKATVGTMFSVPAHKVDIELSISSRRLGEGRRLGTATVKATINTDDPAAADTIKAAAADTSTVASAFVSSYQAEFKTAYDVDIVVETPTVAAPKLEMEIVYSVRTAPNQVIDAPDASVAATFATKLAESTPSLPSLTFEVVTPMPTSAPTKMPTKMPTNMPTSLPAGATHGPTSNPTDAPTKMPTKMPTSGPTKNPTKAPTAAAPTAGAPTAPTAMGTTTAAPSASPPATESAAFNTKVSGCVAIALTMAMVY